jgi:hypothetical protein
LANFVREKGGSVAVNDVNEFYEMNIDFGARQAVASSGGLRSLCGKSKRLMVYRGSRISLSDMSAAASSSSKPLTDYSPSLIAEASQPKTFSNQSQPKFFKNSFSSRGKLLPEPRQEQCKKLPPMEMTPESRNPWLPRDEHHSLAPTGRDPCKTFSASCRNAHGLISEDTELTPRGREGSLHLSDHGALHISFSSSMPQPVSGSAIVATADMKDPLPIVSPDSCPSDVSGLTEWSLEIIPKLALRLPRDQNDEEIMKSKAQDSDALMISESPLASLWHSSSLSPRSPRQKADINSLHSHGSNNARTNEQRNDPQNEGGSEFVERLPKRITDFTVDQVSVFLETVELGEYVQVFRANKIDGELLIELEERDLIEDFGIVNKHHRRCLFKALNQHLFEYLSVDNNNMDRGMHIMSDSTHVYNGPPASGPVPLSLASTPNIALGAGSWC